MKPKVSSAKWGTPYTTQFSTVYKDENNHEFYKVYNKQYKVKYFYGETAWADVQRYLADKDDPDAWSIFD